MPAAQASCGDVLAVLTYVLLYILYPISYIPYEYMVYGIQWYGLCARPWDRIAGGAGAGALQYI
jgi:hypothetical protein